MKLRRTIRTSVMIRMESVKIFFVVESCPKLSLAVIFFPTENHYIPFIPSLLPLYYFIRDRPQQLFEKNKLNKKNGHFSGLRWPILIGK